MRPPGLTLLESALLDLSTSSIASFADEHRGETFYAFGFDCNAEYGDVLLCLNTESDFAKTSLKYIAEWAYGPEDLAELRKNFGDWQYHGFNCEQPSWDKTWQPHKDAMEGYIFSEEPSDEDRDDFIEAFLRMVCRVLVQVERSGALDRVQQDAGFFTQVIDHDENEDEAEARLVDVRTQMAV